MATVDQLQTWLAEALAARHKLATGTLEVSMNHAGHAVTYSATNMQVLNAYIADLADQIATAQGGKARRRTYRVTQTGTGY